MVDYRQMIGELNIPRDARILEIGPLNRPLIPKNKYPNAVYCDIRNTQEIKELYSGNDYLKTTGIQIDISTIVDVDYVLEGGYEATFKEKKFDYIIASHVLEHVEDLIAVLRDIFTVLKPSGQFIIYYPDRRYCFDHFREGVSFRDAYDVFLNKRPALARMVLDFFNSAVPENNPYIFWALEGIPDLLPQNDTEAALGLYKEALAGKLMDDVHYWPFSDSGFIKFLYDATRAELIRYSCKAFYPTQENTQEFVVILQNNDEQWNKDKELDNLRQAYGQAPSDFYNSKSIQLEQQLVQVKAQLEDAKLAELNIKRSFDEKSEALIGAQKQLIDAQIQLVDAQTQLVAEHEKLEQSKSGAAALYARIEALEQSTSWKITKPLRALGRLTHKLK